VGIGGTLEIGGSAAPLSAFMSGLVVSGLAAGDTVDLTNVAFVSGATASAANGFLDVVVGGTSYALGLGTPNTFPGVQFLVSGDGATGTDVTLSSPPVIVSKGNSPYKVSSGRTDTGDTVVSGGSMFVLSGGVADATTVSSGGFLTISHGGTDSGTTLAGKEVVLGLDIGAAVQSGGTLAIHSGGTADPATISSGGTEIISAHGTDFGAQVDGGGVQIVASGGSAISATLVGGTTNSLAAQIVSRGGEALHTVILSGGGLAVSAGGLAV
jgi:autotransporter passenger strand-loop-strand repeat protein